jgi:hypothetical protein
MEDMTGSLELVTRLLGLIWDALTIGFWANHDFPGMPRVSRILLYLGHVLFSIAVTLAESAMDAESDKELAPDSQQAGL